MSKKLTPPYAELLQHVTEGLSDPKIAALYNVNKQSVYRWRRELEIPSRHALKIQSLDPFSQTQKEILIGGLLGDGQIQKTSDTKARYIEGHALAQAPYLQWKSEMLASYVSRFKIDKVKRKEASLNTISHPDLLTLYNDWYPKKINGRWTKRIPKLTLTPLSLAVWYQDDGTNTGSTFSLCVGVDLLSLRNAIDALKEMNFNPSLHWDKRKSGNACNLYIPGTEADRFYATIEKFMHPSMRYKLPKGPSKRRVSLKGRPRVQKHTQAANYELSLIPMPPYEVGPSEYLSQVIEILRKTDFPNIRKTNFYYIKEQVAKLTKINVKATEVSTGVMSYTGNDICYSHMDHLWKVTKGNRPHSRSVFEAWSDKKQLKEAVRILWKKGRPLTCEKVRNTLGFTHRTPTNFRSATARYLIDKHTPFGGTVYDPCAGWGGRLLGFGTSTMAFKYIGVDVEEETIKGLNSLYEDLSPHLALSKEVELIQAKAQEFTPKEEVDLVITSPPYWTAEIYSKDPNQSCNEFPTYVDWVEGFLRPMLSNAFEALKVGGYMVICVADVTYNKKTIPLVKDTQVCMRDLGLEVSYMQYPLRGGKGKFETLLIAQKECGML